MTDHTIFRHQPACKHLSTPPPGSSTSWLACWMMELDRVRGIFLLVLVGFFPLKDADGHIIFPLSTCTYPSMRGIKLLALSRLSETMDGLAR